MPVEFLEDGTPLLFYEVLENLEEAFNRAWDMSSGSSSPFVVTVLRNDKYYLMEYWRVMELRTRGHEFAVVGLTPTKKLPFGKPRQGPPDRN